MVTNLISLAKQSLRQWIIRVFAERALTFATPYEARQGQAPHWLGKCNVCGEATAFYCENPATARESMACSVCRSPTRYRAVARGVLMAIENLTGIAAQDLKQLSRLKSKRRIRVFDTQVPFEGTGVSYPLPSFLRKVDWIDIEVSMYKPDLKPGISLGDGVTNQNLENLTFPDSSFDIVVTSDVMEHVRRDDIAHAEIARILKSGGFYVFTVPNVPEWQETKTYIKVNDPLDAGKDEVLIAESHGDWDNPDKCVPVFRIYGRDLENGLSSAGLKMTRLADDIPGNGIIACDLLFCQNIKNSR